MSSTSRGTARAFGMAMDEFVHRIVTLPRNILGGFSRVIDQTIDNLIGRTNNHNHHHNQPQPLNMPLPMVQQEWAFLTHFEQQYGPTHPFFYAFLFRDALKMARDEQKLLFVYFHSPEHPFTASFCRETLCSEIVVEFVDANFVSWGAIGDRGEGLQMAAALKVSGYPFCAVVAPAPGDNLAVLQQMEGPVTPGELVEILQRTMEEQGAKLEEKRVADQRLKEEQDAAYLAALKIDQERERLQKNPKPMKPRENSVIKQPTKVNISAQTSQKIDSSGGKTGVEVTQILIRFPNGERREQSFSCRDKIRTIYQYIDSLGLAGEGTYRVISNFPRKVYGVDQMGMTLKDVGLHPKASLFLEIL